MRIDAHQHFWSLERGDYHWLTPDLAPIYRDFLPSDLTPILTAHGIDGTVLVQAAPTVAETEFLLRLASQNSFIKGVIGWVDFESANAAETISRLAKRDVLVGLRPMIQDIEDPHWLLRSTLAPAFDAVIRNGLVFDALTLPRHLPNLRALLQRYPNMRVVIDHGSKPNIKNGTIDEWAKEMAFLAQETDAFCKLSGLVTEAGPDWTVEDLIPYVHCLLDSFGPDRLIWGSDWPVCTLAADYADWITATDHLLADLTGSERVKIWGENAAHVYKLRV